MREIGVTGCWLGKEKVRTLQKNVSDVKYFYDGSNRGKGEHAGSLS